MFLLKMERITVFLWCSLLLVSLILAYNYRTDSVKEVFQFINEAKSELKLPANNPNITLVLGNTGSGKSFLVHFAAGDYSKMVSIEPREDEHEYVIYDGLDLVPEEITSPIESRTFIPEMAMDEAGNVWYDCPGFDDARNLKIELAKAILIKTVIENASRVKIVLVVNYASVINSYDHADLDRLLTYAAKLIMDIDRYKNSVALVVNKTPSVRVREDKVFDVQANSVKTSVAKYLRDHRTFLQNKWESEKKIQLINALLKETSTGEYSKISVSWRPNKAGPLNTIPKIVDARKAIRKTILEDISYTEIQPNDFGYPLTYTAKIYIPNMARHTISNISTILTNVDRRVLSALQQRIQSADSIYDKFEMLAIGTRSIRRDDNDVTSLGQLIDKFTALIEALNFTSMKTELDLLEQHESNMHSLNLIAQAENGFPIRDLIANASQTIEYMSSEFDWYSFLKQVYEFLAGYGVQKNVAIYNVANLADWEQLDRPQGLVIDASNFNEFTRRFSEKIEILLTPAKLEELNAVIELTLQSPLQFECKGELVTLKGNFVKSSDVNRLKWPSNCQLNNISRITVYVVHSFFVDSDLNLDGYKELNILADKWSILQKSTFDLNGINGAAHPRLQSPGTPGLHGNAGTNAGNFFGLSRELVNGDSLTVNEAGGNGTDGQDGTGSFDVEPSFTRTEHRKMGSAPILEKFSPDEYFRILLKNEGYDVELIQSEKWIEYSVLAAAAIEYMHRFIIHPKNCCGKTGLGGFGGFGGLSGNHKFIHIGNYPQKSPKFVTNDGTLGKKGINAKLCKSTALDVRIDTMLHVNFTAALRLYELYSVFGIEDRMPDTRCPDQYVNSTARISMPNLREPLKLALPVIEYKTFLRKHMGNSRRAKSIRETYNAIDSNADIDRGYTAIDFVAELNSLEEQFYELKEHVDFLPFYDQLLNRIESYAIVNNGITSVLDRKILTLLYTTTLSKSVSMRSGQQSDLIIDIEKFFDVIIKNIKQLHETSRIRVIEKLREKYDGDLKAKIDEAIDYVANDVQPEIEKLFSTLDMDLQKIANETVELQEKTVREIKRKEKYARIIRRNVIIRTVIGVINVIGKAAVFLGPAGKVVEILTEAASAVPDALIVDPNIPNKHNLPEGVTIVQNELDEIFRKRDQTKLDAIEEEMKILYDTLITIKAEQKVVNELSILMSKAVSIKSRHPLEHNDIEQLCRKFSDFIQNLQIISEQLANLEQKALVLSVLQRISNAMAIIESSLTVYRKFVNDQTKLDAIGQAINADKSAVGVLKVLEDQIYAELIPMVNRLQQSLNEATKNLAGKSSISLNVQQWKVRDTLRSVERKLSKLISDFKNEYGVENCLFKINEAFNLIINIYDRIQSYQDQSKLVNYLSNLQKADFPNLGVLNAQVQELQFNLQANIILLLFNRAVGGFKQAIFPFAAKYLNIHQLPPSFAADKNISTIAAAAESLSQRIVELNTSVINEDDKLIFTTHFDRNSNESRPMYVWPNKEVRDEIRDLFVGKKIYLLADVKRSSQLNAVKFNIIQMQLHSNNQSTNEQIQRILESFYLSLTHMGESNYRCNDQFYTISSPPLTIEQSFRKKDDRPIVTNVVYDKLRSGVKLLSPYTLWAIQLSEGRFDELKPFVDSVDIELHGRGQYVKEGVEICNTDLGKYYSPMNLL